MGGDRSPGPDVDVLRAFLLGCDRAWLVEELLRVAEADPLLAARLHRAAGADPDGLVDLSRLRQRLARAIEIDDYVDYRDAYAYAAGIDEVLHDVDELVEEGFADAAIEVCEYALRLLESSFNRIDDSGGDMGGVAARVQAIHLQACRSGRPDTRDLAERLAGWALDSDWEFFLDAATDYADVLGEAGLARFAEIVDARFHGLPRLEPGQEKTSRSWGDRFRPTYLKEALAARHGPDAVVGVIGHDLSSPYQFWRAATVYADAGRIDDALDWIGRGQAAYGNQDPRVPELAADLHASAGHHDEATRIAWDLFTAQPSLPAYQRLLGFAEPAGQASQQREAALALLRAQPTAAAPPPRRAPWTVASGHSTLVEVLMWEGDLDGAWQAAHHGGCRDELWLELARKRAGSHPADAVPILQREVQRTIEGANRAAYRAAGILATELRGYHRQAGTVEQFDSWIRAVRASNSRRRALQQEFDLAHLPR